MLTTITQFEITSAYEVLAEATSRAFVCGEAALEAKAALDAAYGEALLDGRIEGKNEAQREAQARRLLADNYATVDRAEAAVRAARRDLEVARLAVESLRAQLRLAEVLASALTAAA